MKKVIIGLLMVFFLVVETFAATGESYLNKYMMMAVKKGDIATIRLLKEKGANLNIKDRKGNSLLMLSIYLGYDDIFEYLVKNGANYLLTDNSGRSPLILSIYLDRGNMINYMLDSGLLEGLNIKDISGKTALMIAVAKGDKKLVTKLLKLGANPNEKDKLGRTPLAEAMDLNLPEITKILLENQGKANHSIDKERDLLRYATFSGDAGIIRNMLAEKRETTESDSKYAIVIIERNIFLKKY
ncbi:ankyrin repeat domain-containing protein [Haliovirga abyssi]|uniref:Ankyrin repeat domain-containing protein n=1 Tax=Haliovirga abyssi TaxID=2996794 RepID=A0AAU9DC48_9FUSO|nr:ankyrin repeat domain-containing protein [Haliovirga abyssi]BDU49862.1 hypothetical protein HLVA_04310 [Haliovirga abyssi]